MIDSVFDIFNWITVGLSSGNFEIRNGNECLDLVSEYGKKLTVEVSESGCVVKPDNLEESLADFNCI